MEIIFLLMFVSGVLVCCSVGAFVYTIRSGDHEHADRLALAPVRDDAPGGGL